jgi:hypothetical protein
MTLKTTILCQAGAQPCSASDYINRELRYETVNFLRKCLKGLYRWDLQGAFRHNTPEINRSYYDGKREKMQNWANGMTWDHLIYGEASYQDPRTATSRFVLLDDHVVWSVPREPRSRLLKRLQEAVSDCVPSGGTVVELGSGDGRNLLYLKSLFGDRNFIGLEISPSSVKIAQDFSVQYGLPVKFLEFDVSSEIPVDFNGVSVDLVFSCHTLQMMPRIFSQGLKMSLNLSRKHVVLFEPVWELWPWNRRGVTSRIRCLNNDQARGIMSVISQLTASTGWRLTKAERLKAASSPFVETCEIRLEKIESTRN